MKTIGILGGMSAASTATYYDRLNAIALERLGGVHSADLLIRSFDFAEIEAQQEAGDWAASARTLAEAATMLELAGAEILLLATNTMHKVAETITDAVSIPFLHIADATAAAIRDAGFARPGLMATRYTMEQTFYTDQLSAAGLDTVVPVEADRALTHQIIYDELVKGVVTPDSRLAYEGIAHRLRGAGADCLILGCTEVGMLLNEANCPLPVFDTTLIHCERAMAMALEDQ